MRRTGRLHPYATQRQRDQHHDDQRVEHNGRQNGALRAAQPHDVEHAQLRVDRSKQRRQDREVLGHVIGNRERGQCTTRHQQLLADLHHVQQFSGVAVQIDHVRGFPCSLGAVVHGHAHIGLGQGRGVVGAVTTHGYQTTVILLMADARQFFLRCGLGQHVVHPGFSGNRRGGQRVVARHHHGADT